MYCNRSGEPTQSVTFYVQILHIEQYHRHTKHDIYSTKIEQKLVYEQPQKNLYKILEEKRVG